MNVEDRFEDYVNKLEQASKKNMGFFLIAMADFPSGDKRMLSYLEGYLDDTRITRVYIKPEYYAEVRYAAGAALASERAVQGILEPVIIPATVKLMKWGEMRDLALEARLDINLLPGELLPLLIEKNLVQKRNHIWFPRIPPRWLDEIRKQD